MFVPETDGVVVATMLTQGPWDPNSQYGGTPAALLTWAVEGVPTLVPMRIARITVDMHRRVPLGRLAVDTEIVREGKRLQVVVATISDPDGVEVARATALRFRLGAGPDAPHRSASPADRDTGAGDGPRTTSHGRTTSTASWTRWSCATLARPDAATSWYRATRPVIAGEEPSPIVRLAWAVRLHRQLGELPRPQLAGRRSTPT